MPSKYHFYVILSGLTWATLGVFTQLLNNARVDLFSQVLWRLVFGALGAAGLGWILKQEFSIKRQDWPYILVNAIIFVLGYITFPVSIYLGTPIAKAIFLVYTYPLTLIPLSFLLLKQVPSKKNLLAIGITGLSLAIMFKFWELKNFSITPGELMALVNSICAGAMIVWGVKIKQKTKLTSANTMFQTFWIGIILLIIISVGLTILGIPLYHPVFLINWGVGWWWLIGIGLLATVAPVGLLYAGSKHLKPTEAGVLLMMEPLATYLFGWWLFGQQLEWSTIVGGVGILLSVLLI